MNAVVPGALLCALLLAASPVARAGYEAAWVEFPALNDFNGRPVMLDALMFRPSGAGPFPAIVLLHGCSGFLSAGGYVTASYRSWAERLAERGYVALLPDSFNPRGHRSICDQQKRAILVARERVDDAYAARNWLRGQSYVDGHRIGLMGWSNGGSGTLHAVRASQPGRGFRAAVAFYPGCGALARARPPYAPYAPLLLLAGEADDWTPAAPCMDLVRAARAQGADAGIVTYPGAHHSFDRINSPVRFRPDVRNPNRPGGRGATAGEHPQAREDATRRALEFFARHLKE